VEVRGLISRVHWRARDTNIKLLQTSTINYYLNMTPVDGALAALKSLQPGDEYLFTQCADKYSCWTIHTMAVRNTL
jgi:hypothetical protein